jgi:DNA polymerase-1
MRGEIPLFFNMDVVLISKQQQLITDDFYSYSDDISLAKNYVESIYEVGVDTENSGLNPHTSYEYCFQIGDDKKQFIIDCLTFKYDEFRFLLEYADKLYILQNAKYDLQFFYKFGIIIKGKIWDTYLAELRITNGIRNARKNLQALEEKYLETDYVDKSKRKDIHTIPNLGYTSRVIKYSAGDVIVLPLLMHKQIEVAKDLKLLTIIELECSFVKVLAYSEFCGIYLDKNKWSNIANKNIPKAKELESQLNDWVLTHTNEYPKLKRYIDTQLSLFNDSGPTVMINWNSPKQLIELFELIGLNCTIFEKGKPKKSIEAKILKKQKTKSDIIPIYLEYASVYKEISTYGLDFLKFINPNSGRLHPSYFQVLASGRLSSGGDEQSKDDKTPNIMVIPRDGGYRTCFTAQNPDTHTLINYDYSQMEDVVFANQCKEPQLITLLKDGLDGHAYTAKIAFKEELRDIPLEDVKKVRPDLRQKAKAVKFTVNFGGSGFTIANNMGISKAEGEEIYNNYIDGFPKMKEYFQLVEKLAVERGHILIDDLTGSKYFIDGFDKFKKLAEKFTFDNRDYWDKYKKEKAIKSDWFLAEKEEVSYYFRWLGAIKRHALNLPTQGTSSNITKLAAIYIFKEIVNKGWFNIVKFVLFLHDEIMVECPKTIAEEVSKIVYHSMIKAGKIYCKQVPLDATGGVTEVWEH